MQCQLASGKPGLRNVSAGRAAGGRRGRAPAMSTGRGEYFTPATCTAGSVERVLHRDKHNLRNRLHSIEHDAKFVAEFSSLFPDLPCLGNLRCGAWYVRGGAHDSTCYFKSADSHNRVCAARVGQNQRSSAALAGAQLRAPRFLFISRQTRPPPPFFFVLATPGGSSTCAGSTSRRR